MSRRTSFGRDLGVYGLGTLVAQSATVLATPIFTRLLGPDGYGTLDLITVGLSFLGVVLVVGIDVALVRLLPTVDAADRRHLVASGVAVSGGLSLAAGLGLALASGFISQVYLHDPAGQVAVVVAAGVLPLAVVLNYTREVLRAERRAWAFLVSAVIASFGQVVFGVIAVAVFDAGVTGVFIGLALGTGVALGYNAAVLGRDVVPGFSRSRAAQLVRFGFPLMWSQIAGWSVMFADRVVLTRFVDNTEIGYYALANRIAMVLNLVVYTFGRAWTPFVVHVHAEDPQRAVELRRTALPQVLGVVATVGVMISAPAPEVVRLVAGESFAPAAALVPVLAGAFLLFASVPITLVVALTNDRPGLLTRPALIAAAVNLVGCFVLIPPFGVAGAAWATVAGFGYQAVAYFRIAERIDRTGYDIGKLVWLAVLTVPALATGYLVISPVGLGLVVKGGVIAAFTAGLLLTGVVSISQLRWLSRAVGQSDPGTST